ncbi:hypothetical protein G7046_g5996 [Stylonectria norvegica]|nr:hypothetical protein G7046_g5996 [Stylonectria norvegica]
MDIAKYAAGPESYDVLSAAQISNFFSSNLSNSKDQCDELAAGLLGGPVTATPIQVPAFAAFDMTKLGLAQQIYLEYVPQCVYYGTLGSLHVYMWNRVSGPAYCRVRQQMFRSEDQRLRQMVQGFARFFALAWANQPATLEPLPLGLQDKYIAILDKLSFTLPESLHPTIDMLRQDLHLIFRPSFPIVLQHGDILENNIHVEEATGHITGVVDWHDAFVGPFGLSLGGAEISLGIQTHKDWHFHPSHPTGHNPGARPGRTTPPGHSLHYPSLQGRIADELAFEGIRRAECMPPLQVILPPLANASWHPRTPRGLDAVTPRGLAPDSRSDLLGIMFLRDVVPLAPLLPSNYLPSSPRGTDDSFSATLRLAT